MGDETSGGSATNKGQPGGRFKPGGLPGPGRTKAATKEELKGYKLIAVKRDEWNTLIAEKGEALLEKAIDAALKGDKVCLRILLERMLPALRSVEVSGSLETPRPTLNLQVNVGPGTVDPALLERARGGDAKALTEIGNLLVGVAAEDEKKDDWSDVDGV